MMRPYPFAFGMIAVSTVAFAPACTCSSWNRAKSSAVRSGVSPQSTMMVPCSFASSSFVCRTACPVPSCSRCSTYSTLSPMASRTVSPPKPVTTMLRRAPAASAASMTCCSMDFPAARCRTFGSFDFMRVPLPAANMTVTKSNIMLLPFSKNAYSTFSFVFLPLRFTMVVPVFFSCSSMA